MPAYSIIIYSGHNNIISVQCVDKVEGKNKVSESLEDLSGQRLDGGNLGPNEGGTCKATL